MWVLDVLTLTAEVFVIKFIKLNLISDYFFDMVKMEHFCLGGCNDKLKQRK